LKKHYISWKIFLARAQHHQEKMAQNDTITLFQMGYLNTQDKHGYGMEEEIIFLQKMTLKLTTTMKTRTFSKGISKTADIEPSHCDRRTCDRRGRLCQ